MTSGIHCQTAPGAEWRAESHHPSRQKGDVSSGSSLDE